MEKRILALDIGDRRIGVAVTDPFNSYALPAETYRRTGDLVADVGAMAKAAKDRGAGLIVCGLPLNADGTESAQTEKTRRFIEKLQEAAGMPVICEDERFTSIAAHDTLHEGGVKAEKHKKSVDAVAAAYILEGYLARKERANK